MRSRLQLPATLLLAAALAACDTAPPSAPDAAGPSPDALIINLGYSATVLPLIPAGISDSGVVVGSLGLNVARFYNGVLTVATRSPGLAGDYEASGINNHGAMIGRIPFGRGLFWRAVDQVPYHIISPNNSSVIPFSVNNDNLVVGSFAHSSGATHAFVWTTSFGFRDITPTNFQFAVAFDINDAGVATGYGWVAGGTVQALRWRIDPLTGAFTFQILPGASATGRAVSPSGTVVGTSDGFSTTKLWPLSGGVLPFPGPQNAEPEDFSSRGRVVGYTYRHSPINPHRPWTTIDGSTTWLPVPNAALTDNVAGLRVNACGSIVGTQIFTNGSQQGLIWRRALTCDLGNVVLDPTRVVSGTVTLAP